MRINNNLMAMNTHRQLGVANDSSAKSIEKLSSGYRINRAGDDAAGLAISEKMRGQIRGLNQASANSQDGISMIQTAEGALTETHAILQRMRELAVQSANDTNVDADRSEIQKEINQLTEEITRIAETTEFNTQKLLNGKMDVKFQIGANEGQNMGLKVNDMSSEALNVVSETINMGSKGGNITGVTASKDMDLTGAELTATQGGAVAAGMDANAAGIGEGFARNITGISAADGITGTAGAGTGVVPTLSNGGTANQISITSSGDINWDKIDTASTSTITIGKSSTGALTVDIDVTDDLGQQISVDALEDVDADGNYTYDAHGIKFTISAEDFAEMADDTKVKIDLAGVTGGTAGVKDILTLTAGTIGTKDSWDSNTVTGTDTKAAFTGNKIDFDYSKLPEGATSVKVSGTGTAVTVEIFAGATSLSKDDYAIAANGKVEYDNHGVKFEFNVNDATAFEITQSIESYDTKVAVSNTDPLKFDVTDDKGNKQSIEVALTGGDYSLQEIADAINAEAGKKTGAFADPTQVAVVSTDGKSLTLNSTFEGAKSSVKVTDAGGFAAIFGAGEEKGSDSSIDFTLTTKNNGTLTASKATTAKDVTFTDTSGNAAKFNLKANASLSNVAKDFAASSFSKETTGIDVSSHEAANAAITVINDAISSVSAERSKLGAVQNRLEHTIKNLDTSSENLQAAESRIRDVDMAKEMMEQTKQNILAQASTAMLAQANQAPQAVLQLLR